METFFCYIINLIIDVYELCKVSQSYDEIYFKKFLQLVKLLLVFQKRLHLTCHFKDFF